MRENPVLQFKPLAKKIHAGPRLVIPSLRIMFMFMIEKIRKGVGGDDEALWMIEYMYEYN